MIPVPHFFQLVAVRVIGASGVGRISDVPHVSCGVCRRVLIHRMGTIVQEKVVRMLFGNVSINFRQLIGQLQRKIKDLVRKFLFQPKHGRRPRPEH